VALADPEGVIRFRSEGECHGTIAQTPFGKGGFGYDPIFIPEGHSQTFGELPQEVKDQLSHRASALQKIIAFLADF
jgi:XTP/dITP diphosphohydrolase